MDELSQIDLAFCVDLTTSMTGFLQAARTHMLDILRGLTENTPADLRVGLVGYRDYGTRTKLVQTHPFEGDPAKTRRVLTGLKAASPSENTDAAEAVFAGLVACLDELKWRPRAAKIVLLVGDAPPHGCGANAQPCADRFPNGDASGHSLMSMGSAVEAAAVTLHALGMVPSVTPMHDAVMEKSFRWLATTTGGTYRPARSSQDAMTVVEIIGRRVFGEMDFDRRVWEEVTAEHAGALPEDAQLEELLPRLQAELEASPYEIHASVARLRKRGLPRTK
jgi:hypothetical protein